MFLDIEAGKRDRSNDPMTPPLTRELLRSVLNPKRERQVDTGNGLADRIMSQIVDFAYILKRGAEGLRIPSAYSRLAFRGGLMLLLAGGVGTIAIRYGHDDLQSNTARAAARITLPRDFEEKCENSKGTGQGDYGPSLTDDGYAGWDSSYMTGGHSFDVRLPSSNEAHVVTCDEGTVERSEQVAESPFPTGVASFSLKKGHFETANPNIGRN